MSRSGQCFSQFIAFALAATLAVHSVAGPPPKMRAPQPRDRKGHVKLEADGRGENGFALFVTLAATAALSSASGFGVVRILKCRRPGVAGGVAGMLIGLVAAVALIQIMGPPFDEAMAATLAVGLCIFFGLQFGRQAAIEVRHRSKTVESPPET